MNTDQSDQTVSAVPIAPDVGAITAGIGLLVMAVIAPLAVFGVIDPIVVAGDPIATAANVTEGITRRGRLRLCCSESTSESSGDSRGVPGPDRHVHVCRRGALHFLAVDGGTKTWCPAKRPHDDEWWRGWIQEVFGVNAQDRRYVKRYQKPVTIRSTAAMSSVRCLRASPSLLPRTFDDTAAISEKTATTDVSPNSSTGCNRDTTHGSAPVPRRRGTTSRVGRSDSKSTCISRRYGKRVCVDLSSFR